MELRANLRASRLVLALGAAAAMALGGAGVASAHDTSAGVYGCPGAADRCGYGGVTNSHQRVYSCDTKADGVGFRTRYQLANGDTGYIDDANGSTSGCSGEHRGSTNNKIVKFRACLKTSPEKCTGWQNA